MNRTNHQQGPILDRNRANFLVFLTVWTVSLLAMVTNFVMICRKMRRDKKIAENPHKVNFLKTLWALGRDPRHYSSWFVDKHNTINHLSKTAAASARILSLFYNFNYAEKCFEENGKKTYSFWISKINNSRAVRNRKLIIVAELIKLLREYPQNSINFVSIASGSAEAVIEAVLGVPEKDIKVTLIDCDEAAIAEAMNKVTALGLRHKFSFEIKKIQYAAENIGNIQKIDFVEVAGLLDYLPDKRAVALFSKINEAMVPGGKLITCNIIPNTESIFLTWVLLWPMIYRKPKKLKQLVESSSFYCEKIIVEPLNVHTIIIAQK